MRPTKRPIEQIEAGAQEEDERLEKLNAKLRAEQEREYRAEQAATKAAVVERCFASMTPEQLKEFGDLRKKLLDHERKKHEAAAMFRRDHNGMSFEEWLAAQPNPLKPHPHPEVGAFEKSRATADDPR